MDSPTNNAHTARACDRCTNLKTQCNRKNPCSRCTRLHVQCTRDRPTRSRGRPRRNQVARATRPTGNASRPVKDSSAPNPLQVPSPVLPELVEVEVEAEHWTEVSSEFVDALALTEGLPNLPLDAVSAARLLHQILSQLRHIGFYGILPQDCYEPHRLCLGIIGRDVIEPRGHGLLYSLLAISLELFPDDTLFNEHNDQAIAKDTLRMSALALVPNLYWKPSRLKLDNALCLLFLSYTYCFSNEFADIALRWELLAGVIFLDHVRCLDRDQAVQTLESRTANGLLLQDRILSLLHHGRGSGIRPTDCRPFISSISGEQWHSASPRDSVAGQDVPTPHSRQSSYFQLLCPFVELLDSVLDQPTKFSGSWRSAIEKAEDFYFQFPSDLLRLDSIQYVYQAEAMVWLHGIFIILYGHSDILSLLLDAQSLQREYFNIMLDRSFMISEILPHLLRLNALLTFLSPATVFFILLSSAVQCLALRQYFPFREGSTHDDIVVPPRLLESSRRHLQVLSTLCTHPGRWQHDLVTEAHRLLSYCTSRVLHQAGARDQPFTAINLIRYRWWGSGTGILPLSTPVARKEWHFSSPPEEELWTEPTGQEKLLQNAVDKLCDPSIRICQPGYFDLSHFCAHSPQVDADGSPLCRLTLGGQDNQAMRFLINRFQRSFVAIGESGCPLLDEIFPLAGSYPSILSALLALAARLRAPSGSNRPGSGSTGDNPTPSDAESPFSDALSWHQATISGIRSKLLHIQTEHTQEGDLKEILAASLLLTMFGFPQQVNNWSLHVQGMIGLIESTDPVMVESLSVARLVRAFAAHNDISAFSLGRSEESHRAWLSWDISPLDGIAKTQLTQFEVTIGYPESIITLIALMSAAFEDTRKYGHLTTSLHARLKHDFESTMATTRLALLRDSNTASNTTFTHTSIPWHTMIEVLHESWTPPSLPRHLSIPLSTAILTAWESIRKAALIYLWRGGFSAAATAPLDATHANTAQSYLRQLLYNINGLLDLAESQRITIANAMLWTLVVIGNECGRETVMRNELLRLLTRAQEYFSIMHFELVIQLLADFWARFDRLAEMEGEEWSQPMDLQTLAGELDICVPLF